MQREIERTRDKNRERRERQRYHVLSAVFSRTGSRCDQAVSGVEVGEAAGLTREETFRTIQHLAHCGYLDYVSAGPRVCITEKGVRFLERGAGRRRSIREEPPTRL